MLLYNHRNKENKNKWRNRYMSNLEVKGYRVGYKAVRYKAVNCGDRHFTMEKVKTYDEAMNKIKKMGKQRMADKDYANNINKVV